MIKQLFSLLCIVFLSSCGQDNTSVPSAVPDTLFDTFNTFDTSDHLQPSIEKAKFDSLHKWDFAWALLEPINTASDLDQEKLLANRLSPGQKALYFFWYLDAEVTNGGFIQFYWNGKRGYLPAIKNGLQLLGDTTMIALIEKADNEYLKHKDRFGNQQEAEQFSALYSELKQFSAYDSLYYLHHDKTIKLLEAYARKQPEEFVKFSR